MTVQKQGRGRPNKQKELENRQAKLEKNLVEEILKGNEIMLSNYGKCVEVLVNAATGELKGISPTNQISSAKIVKSMCDQLLENQQKQGEEQDNQTPQPVAEKTKPTAQLISLDWAGGE